MVLCNSGLHHCLQRQCLRKCTTFERQCLSNSCRPWALRVHKQLLTGPKQLWHDRQNSSGRAGVVSPVQVPVNFHDSSAAAAGEVANNSPGLPSRQRVFLTEKLCSSCEQVRPIDDFRRQWASIDGHEHVCRICRVPQKAAYREHKLKPKYEVSHLGRPDTSGRPQTATCSKCQMIKPLSEFHINRFREAGYFSWCKQCSSVMDKARRQRKQAEHQKKVQNKETILCPRCRRNLPISEYHVQPASFNGISTYCKICCSQNTLQMLKRRLPVYDVPAYKTCSRCLCELPSQSFYASTAARSGLHSQCKECYRLSQRERAARR